MGGNAETRLGSVPRRNIQGGGYMADPDPDLCIECGESLSEKGGVPAICAAAHGAFWFRQCQTLTEEITPRLEVAEAKIQDQLRVQGLLIGVVEHAHRVALRHSKHFDDQDQPFLDALALWTEQMWKDLREVGEDGG